MNALDVAAYEKILKDPELNAKVRRVGELLRQEGLGPIHAIFAVALAHKAEEKNCPCGSVDVHRCNAVDQVIGQFLDAYDSAEPIGQAQA